MNEAKGRGVKMVEYALLLIAILLLAAGAFRALGSKGQNAVAPAGAHL